MESFKIGRLKKEIIDTLQLNINEQDIYISKSNIEHIKKKHYKDYQKYHKEISSILNNPDYIGINEKDNSIEYVKEYIINDDFVKVAVRVTNKNRFFVRSMYVLNKNRAINYIQKGTLKKLPKSY